MNGSALFTHIAVFTQLHYILNLPARPDISAGSNRLLEFGHIG
jgi:hypothetical protein